MKFKLESVLAKSCQQREEELNQYGNIAVLQVDNIREVIALPIDSKGKVNSIEDIVLGGNCV